MKIEKIGVIGAMHQEIALLLQDMEHVHKNTLGKAKGARTYYHGNLYGKDTTLVFSRWGKVASASTVTSLIDTAYVNLILFTGVAGAISADLQIGDVVIGNKIAQHDLDARPLYSRYEVPQLYRGRRAARQTQNKSARRTVCRNGRRSGGASLLRARYTCCCGPHYL